jgi:hypothetical protein
MALTKVTKHVVHGSLLVQFKYSDLGDVGTSSTGWSNVGSALTITPQYADSILEIDFSGTTELSEPGEDVNVNLRLTVNGQEEYFVGEYFGGMNGGNGFRGHMHQNDRVHTNYGNFHDFKKTAGFRHAHKPGNTNAQSCQVQSKVTSGRTYYIREGFLIVKEISSGLESTPAG